MEPNLESVHRIQKAAQLSDSTEFITLVNNGISDERSSAKIHVRIWHVVIEADPWGPEIRKNTG